MLTYAKDSNGSTIPGDSFNKLIIRTRPMASLLFYKCSVSPLSSKPVLIGISQQ